MAFADDKIALMAQLENSLLKVWPSVESEIHGGWVVRAANGYSGRANSASAIRPDTTIDHDFVQHVIAYFTARNIAPCFRVSPLCKAGTTEFLQSRGFASRGLAHTMIASLRAGMFRIDPVALLETTASPAWLTGDTSLQTEATKRNPKALEAIVSRIEVPACFATLRSNDQDVGFGLCAIDNGWAEISSIIINPQFTGKGLGRALVSSLLAWAAELGATNAFLQVDVTNTSAISLYNSLGFTPLYDYDTLRKDLS